MSFEKTIAMASSSLIGSGLFLYGLYQKQRLRASRDWPQTAAIVTKAELVHDSGPDSSGYSASVSYEYEVNGNRYTGKRLAFRERWYVRKKKAQAEVDRYPLHAAVPVFYDPENPADAVVRRESSDSSLLIISGVVLLAIAVAGVLYG